jgi:hypothetical protein
MADVGILGMALGDSRDGVPGCGALLSHFSPVTDSPELRPRMVPSECLTGHRPGHWRSGREALQS